MQKGSRMAPEHRLVLRTIDEADAAHLPSIGGGPFVTGTEQIPDVTLICGNCGMTAIIVPLTAIGGQASKELGFRCNACGKYGVLPLEEGDAV